MTAPVKAIVFDREALDAWLATLEAREPGRAAEVREGLELCDYFDTEYAIIREEKEQTV